MPQDTSNKKQAKTRAQRIAEGVANAQTPDEVRDVLALIRSVPVDKLTPEQREYAVANIGVVMHGDDLSEKAKEAESRARTLAEQAKQAREEKKRLEESNAKRQQNICLTAFWVTQTAKLMSQKDLASAWATSESQVSKYIRAAKAADALGTNKPQDVIRLLTAATKKGEGKVLSDVLNTPNATMDTFREALPTEMEKQRKESAEARKQREAENAPQEAAQIGRQFAKLLVLLNKSDAELDVSKVDGIEHGDEIIREVRTAMDAYVKRVQQEKVAA